MLVRLHKVWVIEVNMKKTMYGRIVVPTVICGTDTWGQNVEENRRLNVMEIKHLRIMSDVAIRGSKKKIRSPNRYVGEIGEMRYQVIWSYRMIEL